MKIKDLVYISMFTSLIAVGAFIKLPIGLVMMTFQVMFVFIAGFVLKKKAVYSCLLYLFMGIIGLPIFVHGGGIQYVLQPTFGYIISFIFASLYIGYFKDKHNIYVLCFVGLFIIYAIGIAYFIFIQNYINELSFTLQWAISGLVLPYILQDTLSCVIAYKISKKLKF